MNQKSSLITIAVALLLSSLVIVLTRYYGIALKDIFVGVVAYTLYGLLIFVYFLRFALIFIGVFAIYRILQKQHYKQLSV